MIELIANRTEKQADMTRNVITDNQDSALFEIYAAVRKYGDAMGWTPAHSDKMAALTVLDLDGRATNFDVGAYSARYAPED